MTGDEITLSIPREEPFHEVAHLVLGGFAARLGLSFESLDDLETALNAVLERASNNGHVTVKLCLAEGSLRATVGPFPDVCKIYVGVNHVISGGAGDGKVQMLGAVPLVRRMLIASVVLPAIFLL